MGNKKCIKYMGWKTAGKKPLGRPRFMWEDNIKMDLMVIG
jgi:hypothetical protein